MEIITVVPGDTVSSIAEAYELNPQKIIYDNGIDDTGTLVPGQSLILLFPEDEYNVTEENETADNISEQTGISKRTLFRNNIFLGGNNSVPMGSTVVLNYSETPQINKIIGGYAYDSIPQPLLQSVISYMTYLMPFTYGFTTDGVLIAPDDTRLIETAIQYGAKPLMHLSTLTADGNFSNELANALLSNDTAIENLYANILDTVQNKGYYGVDVDFEFLLADDKERYISFIAGLTELMNANGYITVVALPPKTSDDQQGLLYEGIDYAALGEAANYLFLMTYEWVF